MLVYLLVILERDIAPVFFKTQLLLSFLPRFLVWSCCRNLHQFADLITYCSMQTLSMMSSF